MSVTVLSATSNAPFWTRLEQRIAPFNLLTHPFYQAWTRGELTPADLAHYAAEYWHHVSAFPTYLSALHSRLPDEPLRREVLRNLSDEEGTDTASGRPHSDLWMDFANGMGAGRDEVTGRTPQPEGYRVRRRDPAPIPERLDRRTDGKAEIEQSR